MTAPRERCVVRRAFLAGGITVSVCNGRTDSHETPSFAKVPLVTIRVA